MMKRSSNKMANWDFASPHSRGGIELLPENRTLTEATI